MSQQTNSQWDLGRFFQTLSFFGAVPLISVVQQMFLGASLPSPPQLMANVIFDFREPTEDVLQLWGALDDVVMGGTSRSAVQMCPDGMVFTGTVSTANSGGFASVRTRNFDPALDLSQHSGIKLRVKGDGQRYKFFLRDSEAWDSVAYAYSFDTLADEWIDVSIPFAEMRPVQRARAVNHLPLNTTRIYSLQVMLSKFEYDRALNPRFTPGEFRLGIETINVY